MDMIKLLDDAEKAIATLMLEVNRLNDELDAFKLNYYNTGYSLQLRDKDETIKQQQAEIEALKAQLELATWDEDAWKKFKKDNYEVINLGHIICDKCNNTGWVCERHPDKEAHKCCGGAGMPCECTKESE